MTRTNTTRPTWRVRGRALEREVGRLTALNGELAKAAQGEAYAIRDGAHHLMMLEGALAFAVDFLTDGREGVPPHACEFTTNPEKGACSFHEWYAHALTLLGRDVALDGEHAQSTERSEVQS